jgi:predicted Zn-dependent peptidase
MKTIPTILLCLFCIPCFAQEDVVLTHFDAIEQQQIPEDTALRRGVLPNGLTYYVRRCEKPENRVFFRLLQKGGSMVERDNELGIAHFTEHMMLKSTKHFPNGGVQPFMLRNGINVGPDMNGFTGFNTVQYLLNDIPSDNRLLVDSCLLLLRDWAGDVIIEDQGVESERNVIVEEWRMRHNVSFADQMRNDFFANSAYAERIPIGDMRIIQTCKPKLLRDFYRRWYQPQNQAVVVIGNIDPDAMAEKIRSLFGDLKRGKTPVPVPPSLPVIEQPQVSFYQDAQLPVNSLLMVLRLPEDTFGPKDAVGDMRAQKLRDEVKTLLTNRLKALQAQDKTILSVESQSMPLADAGQIMLFNLNAATERWPQTLEALCKQIEYLRRNGFTDDDIKHLKLYSAPEYNSDSTAIIMTDTAMVKSTDPNGSSKWIDFCSDHFYKGRAVKDRVAVQLTERHVNRTITPEQLHQTLLDLTDGRNMLLFELFPKNAALPTKDEVLAIYDRVRQMSDDELSSAVVKKAEKLSRLNSDSLDIMTVPGSVASSKVLNDSITELQLSNGVKVVLWKTKVSDNQVHVMLKRPQGHSALKDDERFYNNILSEGVRRYQWWGGSPGVSVKPYEDLIDTQFRDMSKAEACMKNLYAMLTSTEVDSVAVEEHLRKIHAMAIDGQNPVAQAVLRISNMPVADTRRYLPPTPAEAATYTVDRFRQVVKEYYSNYNGSVVLVQGEYDTDSIMPGLLKYVAALPSKPVPAKRALWPSDHYKTTNSTVTEMIENTTPICQITLCYTWEQNYQYTQLSHAHNQVLQSVLRHLLFSVLRSQHSDIYTPNCVVKDDQLPLHHMMCVISFTCDPKQRERIAADVKQLVGDMAEGDLITQELIDSYVTEVKKNKTAYKDNDYQKRLRYLDRELGVIPEVNGDDTYICQVTPASLKAHLRQLLKNGNLHVGYLTTE